MAVKTYDPKGINVVIGGVPLTGYSKDSFVKVSRNEGLFTQYKGVDGTGSRAKNNNNSGTIEVTLAKTSASNDFLSALAAADEASGQGTFPVLIKDVNGTTKHVSVCAWVDKTADDEQAKDVTDRTWKITCDDLTMNDGGNNSTGL